MNDDYEDCERCGKDFPPEKIESISLDSEWEVCNACVRRLDDFVEYHDWQDRYTEEHHQRAADKLSEWDEVECVIESYEDGQIVVHTPYVSSDVVKDICKNFGLRITAFGIQWEHESRWSCADEHGSMFEIHLSYGHRSEAPIPNSVEFVERFIGKVDENDKQL